MDANRSSVVGGVNGTASALVADECGRVLGQELSPGEEERHAELAQAAKAEELDNWEKFDISNPESIAMGSYVEDRGWT